MLKGDGAARVATTEGQSERLTLSDVVGAVEEDGLGHYDGSEGKNGTGVLHLDG